MTDFTFYPDPRSLETESDICEIAKLCNFSDDKFVSLSASEMTRRSSLRTLAETEMKTCAIALERRMRFKVHAVGSLQGEAANFLYTCCMLFVLSQSGEAFGEKLS